MKIYYYSYNGREISVCELDAQERPKTYKINSRKCIEGNRGYYGTIIDKTDIFRSTYSLGEFTMLVLSDSPKERTDFLRKCMEHKRMEVDQLTLRVKSIREEIDKMEEIIKN